MVQQRNDFYDVIKAVGIISIVFGHSCWNAVSMFCYSYHLAIFFFVSGLLYKHQDDISKKICKKAASLWMPYVKYSLIILIFHDLFVFSGIQQGPYYNFSTYFTHAINAILFMQSESFTGAMWFIPFFAITCIVFAIFEFKCGILSSKFKNRISKNVILTSMCILLGIFGLILTTFNYRAPFHANLSFMILPIYLLGYLLNQKHINLQHVLRFPGFVVSTFGIIFIYKKTNTCIELSANQIVNPMLFYLITIMGIYSCCYIAKIIYKMPKIKSWFAKIGKYTFDIMALHFLFLKLVDLLYTYFVTKDYHLLSKSPHTYGYKMLIFYIIAGTLGPILMRKAFDSFFKFINSKLKRFGNSTQGNELLNQ